MNHQTWEKHDMDALLRICDLGIAEAVEREYQAAIAWYTPESPKNRYRRQLTEEEQVHIKKLCGLTEYLELFAYFRRHIMWRYSVVDLDRKNGTHLRWTVQVPPILTSTQREYAETAFLR